MKSIEKIPHKGFIYVKVEKYIHPLEPSGKVQGKTVDTKHNGYVFETNGNSKEECVQITDETFNKIVEFINAQRPTKSTHESKT
jgi:hypothetical protein